MTTRREGWPDVAKGLCIILVVLWHVVTKHSIDVAGAGSVTQAWASINVQLLSLRMPLFFLISEMFAGRAVMATGGASWRRRAGRLALVYMIWVLIQTFALALTPEFDTARAENAAELFAQLTFAPTNLWYLLALAAYLTVARVSRTVPTVVLLPIAFAISAAAATGVLPDLGNLWQVFQNLFFFLAGLRFRAKVERFAAGASLVRMLGVGSLYALVLVVVGVAGAQQWPGVWTTLSALAVAFGVVSCVLVDRHLQLPARMLRWVGQRTLPIYVIHMIPLALLDMWLRTVAWMTTPLAEALAPLVLTALVIAASLGAYALLLRCRLGVLFNPLLQRARVATMN